jgi:hypothetical protein
VRQAGIAPAATWQTGKPSKRAAGERRVVIPYAPAIAEAIPPVRLRRDFSTLLALPPTVRETVEAVAAMGRPEVSLTELAKQLHLEKSTTSARVQRAIVRGFLINNETKRGLPARITLGDPLPEERQILPDPVGSVRRGGVFGCSDRIGGGKGRGGRAEIGRRKIGIARNHPQIDGEDRKAAQI